MDNRLRNLIIFFCAVFVVLTANLTYLQAFKADQLLASQYNTRSLAQELGTKRGSIITSDGIEIAQSERISGRKYQRFYPASEAFSAITGYYDARLGRFGLEQKYNEQLLGHDSADSISEYVDRIVKRDQPGNDLILTINSRLQRVAYQNLIGKRGAVVVIRPNTGEVLALASYPGYNPNTLRKDWKKLAVDKSAPLLNRATIGRYPPGSSFKTVTLSAALAQRKTKPSKMYPAPSTVKIYGGYVTNYKDKNYGNVSLQYAFQQSINTVFAKVGLEVGGPVLVDQANKFGFNEQLKFDLPLKTSVVKPASQMDDLEVAWTAVGQAYTLASPLQMAMISSAIANKGKLMKPLLVKKIRDYEGRIIDNIEAQQLSVVLQEDQAAIVRNLMVQVVSQGTGQAATIDGVTVAGKTGTAEVKGKKPHAWFIGFAPANKPKVAVAVLIENAGTGGSVAAPIAREVMRQALKK